MLGNDVVDLRDRESDEKSLSSRFDERVFTDSERHAIEAHADSSAHRWRHWAAKEAAYKAMRRSWTEVAFSPIRFEVKYDGAGHTSGQVRYRSSSSMGPEGPTFHLRLLGDTPEVVHVIAQLHSGPETLVVHGLARAAEIDASADALRPGRSVRKLACARLADHLGVVASDLEVRKNGRIPELWVRGERSAQILSLSHHGQWIGFACAMGVLDAGARVARG